MTTKRTFTARFELDPQGVWLVELVEEPGVHTYGRTLAKARAHIRDAAALWFELEEGSFDIVEDVRLPKDVANAVGKANQARERARQAQNEAAHLTALAAQRLAGELGVGLRDAADILGLSHGRVHQLFLAGAGAGAVGSNVVDGVGRAAPPRSTKRAVAKKAAKPST